MILGKVQRSDNLVFTAAAKTAAHSHHESELVSDQCTTIA